MGDRNTELDILAAARDYGAIGIFNGSRSKSLRWLLSLYSDDDIKFDGIVAVFIDALVDSGHLLPVVDTQGNRQRLYARGLTPEGVRRLYKLEHPQRTWMKANWFPLLVLQRQLVPRGS